MDNDMEPKETTAEREEIVFLDDLTTENLVAAAIWEQIELHRRRGGTSPSDDPTRFLPIDPMFRSDYNNL